MSHHDQVKVAGVTEACRYNDHSMCNNPACSCDCHIKAKAPAPINGIEASTEPKPEKSCPQCGIKRPYNEDYCRLDGAKLTSLMCRVCGVGREPTDLYCWRCGTTTTITPDTKESSRHVVYAEPPPYTADTPLPTDVPDVTENEVLKAIQAELMEAQGVPQAAKESNREVIEQPAGSQGSFKLVSAPNPNKVRPPVRQPATNSGVVRLPIKPSNG